MDTNDTKHDDIFDDADLENFDLESELTRLGIDKEFSSLQSTNVALIEAEKKALQTSHDNALEVRISTKIEHALDFFVRFLIM